MNEFIDKLSKDVVFNRKTFAEAIQEATLVQRNACKRVYDEEYAESSDYFGDYVLKAEIKKEDYE